MARRKAVRKPPSLCCSVCAFPLDGWLTVPRSHCSRCYETYLVRLEEKHGQRCFVCEHFFIEGSIVGGKGLCRVKNRVYGSSTLACRKFGSKVLAMIREREDFG